MVHSAVGILKDDKHLVIRRKEGVCFLLFKSYLCDKEDKEGGDTWS